MKVLGRILAGIVLAAAALLIVLWMHPPDIVRIGANYSAQIVCSNVFLAGRDADTVLDVDVLSVGHPLLRLMRVSVDRKRRVVRAGLLGFIGGGLAVARPRAGCTAVPDGEVQNVAPEQFAAARVPAPAAQPAGLQVAALWPDGELTDFDALLQHLVSDDALVGPGMRAVVVAHRGRIVAERYGAGFGPGTPLLGWSMTKTVMAGLIGTLIQDGRLSLDLPAGWPAGDPRAHIRIADLLAMSSGLAFNESYGAVSDVTRMLYLEPDMAAFARARPLVHPVGEFWSYSSGTALILSRIFTDAAGARPLDLMRERLFAPLGMRSAVLEADEHGTFVGSSYLYASARDWARYAQLLLQDGLWRGQAILPRGYVAMMTTPVAASRGQYGQGQVWRYGSEAVIPGVNPDTAFGIPPDSFWMLGHDGQSIAIIPSRNLVVVRMGLTPAREHYQPQPLIRALLNALPNANPLPQSNPVPH